MASTGARRSLPRERWIVGLLVAFFGIQAFFSMLGKSPTADEPIYLAAGDRILRTGDLETNEISSPFLLKPVLALPLELLDRGRPQGDGILHDGRLIDQWLYARRFLYGQNHDSRLVIGLARGVSIILGLLLALSTYALARRLVGRGGAVATLLLYSFSPHLLAHTRLATLDIGLALLSVECLRQWHLYLTGGGWRRLVLTGLLLGLGMLAKTAMAALAAYLAGVHILLAVAHLRGRGLRCVRPGPLPGLVALGILALLVVNGSFLFHGSLRPLASLERGGPRLDAALEKLGGGLGGWVAHNLPVPLPGSYQRLMLEQAGRARSPKRVYFHGNLRPGGWWWFMPVAWGLKTPLAVVVLVLGGMAMLAVRRWRGGSGGCKPLWCILGFAPFLFFFYSFVSQFGLVRYLLPVEPLLLLAAGALLARIWGRVSGSSGRTSGRLAAVVLAGLAIYPGLSCYPHYLAFTNRLTGGMDHAWRWFADSNLDWGQDLDGLARYVKQRGIEKIALAYFGSADPDALGLRYRRLPSIGLPPEPGHPWWWEEAAPRLPVDLKGPVAISVTCLAGILFPDPDLYARFREQEPVAQVGHSILIYESGQE